MNTLGRLFEMKRTFIILSICLAVIGIAAAAPADWGCDWTDLKTIPLCIVYIIFDLTIGTLLRGFYAGASAMILLNPDLKAINPAFQMYRDFLYPFFMLYLVLGAFYLLFMAGSPSGRGRAKSMFWKLMLAMIMVTLSPQLFKIIMTIAHDLAQSILAIASSSVGISPGGLVLVAVGMAPLAIGPGFILFTVLFAFAVILFLISVGLRWLGVLILAAVFPITIFFYFFEPPIIGGFTKPLADTLMKSTFTYIFAQTLQALMLAIAFTALGSIPLNNPAAAILQMGIAIVGLVMVGAAPLMMMDIMTWIGGAMMAAGMALSLAPGGMIAGAALTGIGGSMMGMGPGSLWAAGGSLSMGMARRASAAALDGGGHGGAPGGAQKMQDGSQKAGSGMQRMSSGAAGIGQDVEGIAAGLGTAAASAETGVGLMAGLGQAGASLVKLAADVGQVGMGVAQTAGGVMEAGQGAMQMGEELAVKPIHDRYRAGATLLAQQRQQQQNQQNQNQGGP